jgi:hypothetical protein
LTVDFCLFEDFLIYLLNLKENYVNRIFIKKVDTGHKIDPKNAQKHALLKFKTKRTKHRKSGGPPVQWTPGNPIANHGNSRWWRKLKIMFVICVKN